MLMLPGRPPGCHPRWYRGSPTPRPGQVSTGFNTVEFLVRDLFRVGTGLDYSMTVTPLPAVYCHS